MIDAGAPRDLASHLGSSRLSARNMDLAAAEEPNKRQRTAGMPVHKPELGNPRPPPMALDQMEPLGCSCFHSHDPTCLGFPGPLKVNCCCHGRVTG